MSSKRPKPTDMETRCKIKVRRKQYNRYHPILCVGCDFLCKALILSTSILQKSAAAGCAISCLRNNVAPYGAILNAVLASSPRLRQLEVDQCITIDEMTQLPRLSELMFLFIATPLSPFPLPRLSSGGLPRLRHLKLQETNATLMLMEIFLAMHPTTELVELSYQAQWYIGKSPCAQGFSQGKKILVTASETV
jgi:hypothetical protein